MGQELACTMRFQTRTLSGKALLETDYVMFRGEERLKVRFEDLTGVRVADGVLRLEFAGGPAELELGGAAEKWAHKILHPPSRLDKLGVKGGTKVRLVGGFDRDFLLELKRANANILNRTGKADLVFMIAGKVSDLDKIVALITGMELNGGIWVIYPKGVTIIREIQVIEAGRAAGLKDVKVASFSATHTGLKFVIPIANR